MTRTACVMLLLAFAGVGLGCETSDLQPAKADTTYGAPVDASKAIPARAVLEQGAPLAGCRLVLDGASRGLGRTDARFGSTPEKPRR